MWTLRKEPSGQSAHTVNLDQRNPGVFEEHSRKLVWLEWNEQMRRVVGDELGDIPGPDILPYVCVVLSFVQLCNPLGCRPPGSSAHEIFHARILGWVAISYSKGYS